MRRSGGSGGGGGGSGGRGWLKKYRRNSKLVFSRLASDIIFY